MKARSELREQLYRLLPAMYRDRDNPERDSDGKILVPGDLAQWLGAHGELLDQIHKTLAQMDYDHFPDEAGVDENGTARTCQPWLLPYFAQLLDVTMVSPDSRGQRAEIAKAVAWRQSKGTLPCVEDIAQDVGQFEVEIQEGWKRTAVTPRVGDPLLPAKAIGEAANLDMENLPASRRSRHPGLKAATVDFRRRSRAVRCETANPAAHTTTFGAATATWRIANPHGVPCLPGSYQDVSLRTPDVRLPDWRRGHYHPRRVLLYMPPPEGYFSSASQSISWSAIQHETDFENDLIEIRSGTAQWHGHTVPLRSYRGKTRNPLKISAVVDFNLEGVYRFENLWLDKSLDVQLGKVELLNCAVRKVTVQTVGLAEPVLDARGCLIRSVHVASGMARLEYCTVLFSHISEGLQASDCVFLPLLHKDVAGTAAPAHGCVRFSRLEPQALPSGLALHARSVTRAKAWFFSEKFGEPGCGVLHPGAAASIRFGAEDGGEMGAFHDRLYSLRQAAILDKLRDYLPVGLEAALIPDKTLACPPPQAVP